MGKGYRLVELEYVADLAVDKRNIEYAVVVYSWLIKELYLALNDQLADVELEVIKVIHFAAYPSIGIHYKPSMRDEKPDRTTPEDLKIGEEIEKLVQRTAEKLLEERPVREIIQFIGSSDIDWKARVDEIMK